MRRWSVALFAADRGRVDADPVADRIIAVASLLGLLGSTATAEEDPVPAGPFQGVAAEPFEAPDASAMFSKGTFKVDCAALASIAEADCAKVDGLSKARSSTVSLAVAAEGAATITPRTQFFVVSSQTLGPAEEGLAISSDRGDKG